MAEDVRECRLLIDPIADKVFGSLSANANRRVPTGTGMVQGRSRPGSHLLGSKIMGTLEIVLLIVVLLVVFGGGGGYYWSRRGR